ncbi:MAG: hypothetical protein KJ626_05875 [Verrucomicrobia bacterium]|nr:hypothetical protein [Verrucomicrobiota bacterium]
MTDKKPEEENGQEPPKINLNGANGNGNGLDKPDVPDEVLTSSPGPEAPPKISIPTGRPLASKKKDTTRIDLSAAAVSPPVKPGAKKPDETTAIAHGVDKKSTLRVDAVTDDLGKEAPPDFPPKHATMRIQLEDETVSSQDETVEDAQIAREVEEPKKETARIDLSEVLTGQEEKSSKSGGAPKTIRLKKPDSTAPTVSLKRPSEPPEAGTMMISAPEDFSEAPEKGATARIDLPSQDEDTSVAPTRRKTIRIKRPDGSTGAVRPMTVARTGEFAPPLAEKEEIEEGPGVGMTIVAVAATLVAAVLVYVLVAQLSSIGLDKLTASLPWAGRIL